MLKGGTNLSIGDDHDLKRPLHLADVSQFVSRGRLGVEVHELLQDIGFEGVGDLGETIERDVIDKSIHGLFNFGGDRRRVRRCSRVVGYRNQLLSKILLGLVVLVRLVDEADWDASVGGHDSAIYSHDSLERVADMVNTLV